MFLSLNNFDPISFLEINASRAGSSEELKELRMNLLDKMGEYVLFKLTESLPQAQQQYLLTTNSTDLLSQLKAIFPDLEQRMMQELESFKTDFQKQ